MWIQISDELAFEANNISVSGSDVWINDLHKVTYDNNDMAKAKLSEILKEIKSGTDSIDIRQL